MAAMAILAPSGALASAGSTSVLALLDEGDSRVQGTALSKVFNSIDSCWTEAADYIGTIEALSEDASFPQQQLASALASKIYYHLEEYGDAVKFALAAGALFDVDTVGQYEETIVAQCIRQYAEARKVAYVAQMPGGDEELQGQLEGVVDHVLQRCRHVGAFTQAIGVALETFRMDQLRLTLDACAEAQGSQGLAAALRFTFNAAQATVTLRGFRREVVGQLVEVYAASDASSDVLALCKCHEYLGAAKQVAQVIADLLRAGDDRSILLAYQIAFDAVDNDNQQFLADVGSALPAPPAAGGAAADGKEGEEEEGEFPATTGRYGSTVLEVVRAIISGRVSSHAYLHFMSQHSKSDMLLMERVKNSQAREDPVLHHAMVVTHGYMNAGTAQDGFLRKHMDWLKKGKHWAQFSAAAAQGVVQRGNRDNAMKELEPYLPQDGGMANLPYVEGGALYALGLVHAARGVAGEGETVAYLTNALQTRQHEVIQHGALLGLGLATMSAGDDTSYSLIRNVMFASDSSVAGEAAGMAIGLTLLGKGPGWVSETTQETAVEELMVFAKDTEREKTTRGVAMGLAFVCYGLEEGADVLIDELCRQEDSLMRYGGMYAVGMAYVGTGNNDAVRRLLHVTVSDVNDDVRRAAVTNLGFVLFQTPDRVPQLVSLLTESYNPHVRYGAAMAVGIACAGSANTEAVALLKPLTEDRTDFVKQGALMALALVLQQAAPGAVPAAAEARELFTKTMSDKRSSVMVKMGAIVAQGIIDAGGRNAVVSMGSTAGFVRMPAVVGVALWLQHWYWFPYMHMLSLALVPTALVGLNKDLALPAVSLGVCDSKPSAFAYPDMLTEDGEGKKERVETVKLSTAGKGGKGTNRGKGKARARAAARKRAAKGPSAPEEDVPAPPAAAPLTQTLSTLSTLSAMEDEKVRVAAEGAGEETPAPAPAPAPTKKEPAFFTLANPCRVTRVQAAHVRLLAADSSAGAGSTVAFEAIRGGVATPPTGIVMLAELGTGAGGVEATPIHVLKPGERVEDGEEPEPPAPFDWTPPEAR